MKKRFLKITTLLLTVICLCTAFSALSICTYASVDERQAADCIIVLGAGTNGKEPNPVFRERLNHAVTLYGAGYADTILLT